jgi:hypothetical protein
MFRPNYFSSFRLIIAIITISSELNFIACKAITNYSYFKYNIGIVSCNIRFRLPYIRLRFACLTYNIIIHIVGDHMRRHRLINMANCNNIIASRFSNIVIGRKIWPNFFNKEGNFSINLLSYP